MQLKVSIDFEKFLFLLNAMKGFYCLRFYSYFYICSIFNPNLKIDLFILLKKGAPATLPKLPWEVGVPLG
jgi:hypothetical protein